MKLLITQFFPFSLISFFLILTSWPNYCWRIELLLHLITLSDTHTPLSVGLPWKRDRPVAQTYTWQHITLTRGRHPRSRRDSNPQSQQASCRWATPYTALPLQSASSFLLGTNTVILVTTAPIFDVLQPPRLPRLRNSFYGKRSSRIEHFAELNSFQGHFRPD